MIKKILIEHLKPGMYVADLNNQWVPANNASRRGVIRHPGTIDKIKKLGVTELYIDTAKGLDCPEGTLAEPVKQAQAEQLRSMGMQSGVGSKGKRISVEKERERAEKTYAETKALVSNILLDVKAGKGLDKSAIDSSAAEVMVSLNANENALACMTHIRSKDEYLLEHSVNVGILTGIFCRAKRVDAQITEQLVAGALLHDIGKVLVPDEVLHKPGKLSADEWEEMKRHVTYGEQILDSTQGLSDISRSICQQHHERLDGTGYPRGLKGDEISQWGRMAAICDVYDAITADRVYHKGMAPNDALRKLVEWSVFHLDKDLVYDFIGCLSTYPVGTLVELSNGRAAVVIEANRRDPKLPKVKVFYNTRHHCHIDPHILDLSDPRIEPEITATLDARECKIDITAIL